MAASSLKWTNRRVDIRIDPVVFLRVALLSISAAVTGPGNMDDDEKYP